MAANYCSILTLGLNYHGNSLRYCFITLAPEANVIKLFWKLFMVNYRGKKTLLFLGLKYCSNILSYCCNLPSFQGKFNVINIPIVI